MYDLAVIGGGPGGYVAAERAGAAGLSVVLFERNALGGVCLNEGCIPTKTLLYSAKLYDYARHSDRYGVRIENPEFDYGKIIDRKEKVVKKLVGGIKLAMRNATVKVVSADALIKGRDSGGNITVSAAGTDYVARNLLICTGSEAVVPPIPGVEQAGDIVMTNREILALRERPEELVVIGGGVIGMEFVSFFNSLGTKVTVIEMLPKILGPVDEEISTMLQGIYAKRGVEFRLGCKVTALEGGTVVYEDPEGNVCRVSGDRILMSVGRKARLKGFALENLGVECGRGIKVDAKMRTNVPNVYAAGDVTGFSMLAHTASREAEVAVNTILGREDSMRYDAVPAVVYTAPEVASVGLTESAAVSAGLEVRTLKLPMAYSGRFVAENERGEGLCKVIVSADDARVLGVHMLGTPSSEIIAAAAVAIEQGMSAQQLREVIFPHPSVSEILKETLFTL